MSTKFELLVDGARFGGWKSIRVTRGLERATADFDLTVSEWRFAQSTGASDADKSGSAVPEDWQILPGSECEVYVDDELLLTGYTDAYRPSFGADAHDVQLTGRSKTADFVDSSVTLDGGQLTGMTVLEIAKLLAEPFGIEVIAETTSDAKVGDTDLQLEPEPEVQCQPSETCFDLVERLARLQELLITDNPEGQLVLTRAGSLRAFDGLVQGDNVLTGTANLDDAKRFSDYIVKAQRPGNRTHDKKWAQGNDPWADFNRSDDADEIRTSWRDWRLRLLHANAQRDAERDALRRAAAPRDGDDEEDEDGAVDTGTGGGTDTETDRGADVINQIVGTAKDPGVSRYRPKVIVAEAQADDGAAQKRADWEMRRRIAKATEATISVVGWRQSNGELWRPNMMVSVDAPWLSLDRELLISAVEYSYGNDGEVATLTLTLPDAFLPEKWRKSKKKKGGKGGGKGKAGAAAAWADFQ